MLVWAQSVCLFVTPWNSVYGIFLARYWSGLPCPSPGNTLDPGIKPMSPVSPALAGRFFTSELPGNPYSVSKFLNKHYP